jgi:hypothetical protein
MAALTHFYPRNDASNFQHVGLLLALMRQFGANLSDDELLFITTELEIEVQIPSLFINSHLKLFTSVLPQ